MLAKYLLSLPFTLLLFSEYADAQKNIILDEALTANADQYKIKLISWIDDIWKVRFGDYVILKGKGGRTSTDSKSNITGTRAQTKSVTEFSFDLTKGSDVAAVKAANNLDIKSSHGLRILPNFSVGKDEITRGSNHFLAIINIDQDTSNTWNLLLNNEYDTAAGGKFLGILSNGNREINLTTASSIKVGKKSAFSPALGYIFEENGVFLGAVQFWGGVIGMNRRVWLTKGLDPEFELILAAAMTAIVQLNLATTESDVSQDEEP